MQREYKISLSQEFYSDVVYLSQYDSDYDVIFKVMNKHSAVDVDGKSAKFTGTRKDGLGFTFEAVGIGSYVSFEINTSLTAVAGHHTAEIVFYDSQGLYFGSANVQVVVEPAARKDGTIDADTERAQEIAEEIQEIVDTAAATVKGEAEAWAVGQRDGVDVPSTDPAYENNAKYYAEQARDIADSIGIDATLSVAGKAADAKKTGDEISELKEDLNLYNSYDVLRQFATFADKTSGGITYTWNSDKTICTAVGTTTGTSFTALYNAFAMPVGVVAGEKYYIKCDTSDPNLMLEIITYNGNTSIQDDFITDDILYKIPDNATGLTIRIRTRHTSQAPSTINATISVQIVNAQSNAELTTQVIENTETIDYSVKTIEGFNVYDLLRKFGTYTDKTGGGITYTWNADKSVCTAVGTTTGLSVNTMYTGDGMPTGMVAGGSYFIKCNTTDPNLLFEIIAYNGSTSVKDDYITEDTPYEVPSNATTIIARIRTRHSTGSPSTVNATISVQILNAPTNQNLLEKIDTPQMGYMQIFPKYTTIGDSLMGGYMKRGGVTINTATAKEAGNNWVNYLALRIGRTFTNLAVGNTTTGDWRTNYISGANIDTDAYIVGLGVNDHRQEVTIGSASDIAENFADNANSFYGNYDYILRQLHAWKSDAHIFCFTIPAVEGGTSEDYNVAIRAICALYPSYVHCIDLAKNYANLFSDPIVTGNYTGGHFNPVAYSYMSMCIEKAINTYIKDHDTLFATSPYA